jgi:F-type H+-transporting ATPase subunit delta
MKDQIDKIVEGIIAYLRARNQIVFLPKIIEKLQSHVREKAEIARIISAVSLTLEEKTAIKEYLRKTFGKDFEAEVFVDPSIIGGFIIRVGDRVIDESLKGKLKKISEELES